MHIRFQHPYALKKIKGYRNCELSYIDEGSGARTILFIHGLATYSYSWIKNIDRLKEHCRCVALDLPGNGYSAKGDHPYDMPFFAHTVIDLIGRLNLSRVCLAGHSMGGQIAMNAVLSEPACADRLILCAPAGFERFSPVERSMYQQALSFFDLFSTEENSLRKTIRSSFYQHVHQADDMIGELVELMRQYPVSAYRKMIEACIRGMLHDEVFDRLHLIRQPTLVLYGERDALIPNRILHHVSTAKIAEEGTARIPDAKLVMIPKCGHFLQWEKATAVNECILDWLVSGQ